MPSFMRATAVLAVLALFLAGCGAQGPASSPASGTARPSGSPVGGPQILPLLINSEILKGPNRFVFSLTDRQNKLVAAPDVTIHLSYYDVDTAENTVVFESDARFLWAIEGEQGLYVTDVTFPKAGRWGTLFEATFPDGSVKAVRADYDVAEAGTTPALGARAPSIDTPTLQAVGGDIAQLSTDAKPDRRFYETSVSQAVASGEAFVLSFATPAFCQTRLCGPTLETVKTVATDYPGVTFINVEPYRMAVKGGRLQPVLDDQGQLQTAPWSDAYGLRSEPYTFVIAKDGTVAAKFEGVISEDELRGALDAL